MKIELKINTDALIVLSQKLSGVYIANPITTNEKVMKCVLMDVFDRVSTKAKELQRKQTLFDSKKKVTISLKYHQAFYLNEFLNKEDCFESQYQMVQVRKITNILDQKLC